jgi:hypothetical protein
MDRETPPDLQLTEEQLRLAVAALESMEAQLAQLVLRTMRAGTTRERAAIQTIGRVRATAANLRNYADARGRFEWARLHPDEDG